MRDYISVDKAKATPAVSVDGRLYDRDSEIPNGKEIEYGYKVHFDTGEECFCDAAEFEHFFLPLDVNENLKTDKPSISERMVDSFIARFYSTTVGDKTTVVRAVLVNGFEIVESSSCVSPENYDEEIGISICTDKIKDKVWELLGFLLATAVNGFNYESRYPSILHEEMKGSLEEEALPFSDLPEQESVEEGCGGDDCADSLSQTPYGSEGYCPDPADAPTIFKDPRMDCEKFPECPVDRKCCSCEESDCSCRTEAANYMDGDYLNVHSNVEKCDDPVSIIIEEDDNKRLKIEMKGDSEYIFAALESAVAAAFCSEFHDANVETQKLCADGVAASIGRRIRETILGTVTTENK